MNPIYQSIRDNVIGDYRPIHTPFGDKPLIYADYTASGRGLQAIENFIQHEVLPWYANTHTESSYTGRQTTRLREEARAMIRRAVNGTHEDQIIFCGPGATAAINKLIDILNLSLPADLDREYGFSAQIPEEKRPVIFIGPYEHHSNELPWRESIADVVTIPLTQCGQIDLGVLEAKLQMYSNRPLKIGSFSAASNVTGLKSDTNAISRLLHRYGALSFWDYAAAAPYVGIDVTGRVDEEGDSSKDAIFISPHKFIGGPGTPGILVVKKALLTNSVPAVPGGGTVSFVTPDEHRYLDAGERREEGGTPAIIESIRAGLVFQLQQQVGTDNIEQREHQLVSAAMKRWRQHDNIKILGSNERDRLSIVSFQITHQGNYLHYGFVVALLNDLFGIQSRGGCSCAGPYGHQLLGIDHATSKGIEAAVADGEMILRPGWVRMNFNYFIDEPCFEYIVRAVELIARYGAQLLPYYEFDKASSIWRFNGERGVAPCSLSQFSLDYQVDTLAITEEPDYQSLLAQAEAELTAKRSGLRQFAVTLSEKHQHLRWFTLPQEIAR